MNIRVVGARTEMLRTKARENNKQNWGIKIFFETDSNDIDCYLSMELLLIQFRLILLRINEFLFVRIRI